MRDMHLPLRAYLRMPIHVLDGSFEWAKHWEWLELGETIIAHTGTRWMQITGFGRKGTP